MNTKKATLLLLLTFTFFTSSFAQKLEENKVDEFTGSSIKRTSWETLGKRIKMTNTNVAYVRISKINKIYFFDVRMATGLGIYSIYKR